MSIGIINNSYKFFKKMSINNQRQIACLIHIIVIYLICNYNYDFKFKDTIIFVCIIYLFFIFILFSGLLVLINNVLNFLFNNENYHTTSVKESSKIEEENFIPNFIKKTQMFLSFGLDFFNDF